MAEKAAKCMICAKEVEPGTTICKTCSESVRGEAVGKQKKVTKSAEKEVKKHGEKVPEK